MLDIQHGCYCPDKEGARHHGYTSQRGYHPLLARAWTLGPEPATC